MTILEASIKLIEWFRTNESFELSSDFIKIIPITITKREDLAALKCALKNLTEANLVGKETVDNIEYHILNKPLESIEQTINVSFPVALEISKTINSFCERMKIQEDICDYKNIREKDLKNMVYLLNNFLKHQEESSEGDKEK